MKVTVVFDIGRTNKKYVLFDEEFRVVEEKSEYLPETTDEDGFPCDDLSLLTTWVKQHWEALKQRKDIEITAVNAAGYGASLVHLNVKNEPVTPLYSYLKPFPLSLSTQFYSTYGDPMTIALQTGSPLLGMLNSGMQLYWIKYEKPELYKRIHTTLHFPQYILHILTGRKVTDFTSLGCHTMLWSLEMMDYHAWAKAEWFHKKFPPLLAASSFISRNGDKVIQSGFGLHDSSAALIPYRMAFKEPFILLSTGTWCINFNPFNARPLTSEQLLRDCLHYLTPEGSGVKASRVFMGREHDYQVERIAAYFNLSPTFYRDLAFDEALLAHAAPPFVTACMEGNGPFPDRPAGDWQVSAFGSAAVAYHHLMAGLTELVATSLELIGVRDIPTLFIDGGFARNDIFRKLMKRKFPTHKIFSTELPHATALGAALHIVRPQKFDFPGEIHEV